MLCSSTITLRVHTYISHQLILILIFSVGLPTKIEDEDIFPILDIFLKGDYREYI